MIVMSQSPTRVALKIFGLSLSILIALIALVLGSAVAGSLLIGFVSGTLCLFAGSSISLFRPAWLRIAYHGWNSLAASVSQMGGRWVAGAVFYVVLPAIGPAIRGGAEELEGRLTSMWNMRTKSAVGAYSGQPELALAGTQGRRFWVLGFIRWAWSSGNGVLIYLVPFMILLRVLALPEKNEVPTHVYTLY